MWSHRRTKLTEAPLAPSPAKKADKGTGVGTRETANKVFKRKALYLKAINQIKSLALTYLLLPMKIEDMGLV